MRPRTDGRECSGFPRRRCVSARGLVRRRHLRVQHRHAEAGPQRELPHSAALPGVDVRGHVHGRSAVSLDHRGQIFAQMRLLQLRGQEPPQRRLPEVPPDRVQEKLAVHRWRGSRSLDRSAENRKPLLPFDTCAFLGEMGSPLVVADTMKGKLVKGSPTEDLLVGIKSFGTSDSEGKTCAVYTSVSFFRTWIMKTIGGKTKPSRCMLVPKAELEKGHHPVLQQPEPISPVPEAESEQVTESPVPEAESEPVTESPVPEAESEPVTESPVPETKSEAGDQQLIDEFRSLTEEQQIQVGGFHSHSCRLIYTCLSLSEDGGGYPD